MADAPADQLDITQQPVSDIQLNQLKVEWVKRDTIHPNNYNPNTMTWHDRQLLKQSLLEDGWTQPIVVLPDLTIVDGEQRWTTSGIELTPKDIQDVIDHLESRKAAGQPESESILKRLHMSKERLEAGIAAGLPPCIATITGGLVPITRLDLGDDAHKIISTIRHNRARGTHGIDSMAGLTQDLVQLGLDFDDLETRLGMTNEEIQRFIDMAKDAESMLEDLPEYGQAWEPVHMSAAMAEDPEFAANLQLSQDANKAIADHNKEMAERERKLEEEVKARVEAARAEGKNPTQDDKAKIRQELEKSSPRPPAPAAPVMEKIVFFVTKEEYALVVGVLGSQQAANLVKMSRWWATARAEGKVPEFSELE